MKNTDHSFSPKPVLLLVLDGIRPDVMRAAIRDGEAPNLSAIAERGEAIWNGVSVFPSITPAATAAIATGEPPSGSGILGHAWYDREEERVVVYGAKTETVITTGPIRVFHNNVWRMNRDHLLADTLFEELHEIGQDGACVNFPIRRGPHEHPVRMKTVEQYLKGGRYLGASVDGPKEYFMGDLFYSRETGFNGRRGNGGIHRSVGINDEYAAEVGAMLVKERAAPFNLIYFFKGDSIAHHHGLAAQRAYVAVLDSYLGRIFEAGGGRDAVLDEYAVIAVSDHGHAPLLPRRRLVSLKKIAGERVAFGSRARFKPDVSVVAVPNGRAASLYLRPGASPSDAASSLISHRGVDLAAWREGEWVAVRNLGHELRFRPAPRETEGFTDPFGSSWEIEGDPRTLDMEIDGGRISCGEYPDALGRLWGCLLSPRCGDVVLSATPGYTFGEVSGGFHEASDHGSLHQSDSEVFVLASGIPAPPRITDIAPLLLEHFRADDRRTDANRTERNVL